MDEKFTAFFAALIEQHGPNEKFLEIFKVLMIAEDEPIERNQNMVIKVFEHAHKNHLLHFIHPLMDKEHPAKDEWSDDMAKNAISKDQVNYNILLVEVLIAACDNNTQTQSILRSWIPMWALEGFILSPVVSVSLKWKLLTLVNEAYLKPGNEHYFIYSI